MPRLPTALLLLACALSSTACSAPPPPVVETRLVRVEVPPALLDCTPRPPKPEPACASEDGAPTLCERDALDWLAGAVLAGDDCRSALDAVREYLAEGLLAP